MEITKAREMEHLHAQENMSRLVPYYLWALKYLTTAFDLDGAKVWDASAGVGIIADHLRARVDWLLLTEFSEENLRILREKYADDPSIKTSFCDLTAPDPALYARGDTDAIINLDVLEHLADDVAAMKTFYQALRPGGCLLVKCPAHQALFSGIDEASLHYRRYSRSEMAEKLRSVGFRVVKIRYMNAPGAALYFIKGKILRRRTNFSNTISGNGLSLIEKSIPLIRYFERRVELPFGLSVIAVAQKPL